MGWEFKRQPGHLVVVLGARQLVHGVQEDEEGPLLGRQAQKVLEEGGDGNRVVRDILEGEVEGVGDLLTD